MPQGTTGGENIIATELHFLFGTRQPASGRRGAWVGSAVATGVFCYDIVTLRTCQGAGFSKAENFGPHLQGRWTRPVAGNERCAPEPRRVAIRRRRLGRRRGVGHPMPLSGAGGGVGRPAPPCRAVRMDFWLASDAAALPAPIWVGRDGILATCSAASAALRSAMRAARRAKSWPMPRSWSSILAISQRGRHQPARASSAWIRNSINSPRRSAGERFGVLFTHICYST